MKMFGLIDDLYEIGSIKIGSYKLKCGLITPFYIDLRHLISYPKTLEKLADALWEKISKTSPDRVCGVPYNAIALTSIICFKYNIPMLLKRKEKKDYGTKKMIEGLYHPGEKCVIVEDVIVSGQSVIETIEPLEELGLTIQDIFVIVDREQGGSLALEKLGYNVTSLFKISEIFTHLKLRGKISSHDFDQFKRFIETHPVHF
jgi:uridine monophosphate synthetase